MKRILLLTIGAAVLLSVSFAFGQNTTVQFTGATYGNNWNGFGTGFYSGTFNGVAAVPGSSFYANKALGRNKIRFAFCKTEETLRSAIERLEGLGSYQL